MAGNNYEGGGDEADDESSDDSDEEYSCFEKLLQPVQFLNTDSVGNKWCKFCAKNLTDKEYTAV